MDGRGATSAGTTERAVHAMGSSCHVIVVDGHPAAADDAVGLLADLEARWSRFRADSEVSRANAAAGSWVAVSPATHLLIRRAVAASALSGGLFDPLVLGDVLAAGYDRDLDDLRTGRRAPSGLPVPLPSSARTATGPAVELGPGVVRIPPGTGVDPGGIGKGLAADLVVAALLEAGAAGACVNVGGDLRVAGRPPRGAQAWTVAVATPDATGPSPLLGLAGGAVATSTTRRRRWAVDGVERHHLVDPRTGLPSDSPLASVTALAAEGWLAEVVAKAVLLSGGPHLLPGGSPPDAAVRCVGRDGRVTTTASFDRFSGTVAA